MLDDLYRNALWITVPLLCISVTVLAVTIKRLIRLIKSSLIVRVPLAPQQTVDFAEAGAVSLCIEGPRFSTRFAGLKYRLEAEDGADVPSRMQLFRAQTSGVSTVRVVIRRFTVPRPGQYTLHVGGLENPDETPGHALVFMKPHTAKTIVLVVRMTLASVAMIGSFVMSLIRVIVA